MVVRIEDRDGGAEGYTFDLTWGGGSGFSPGREGDRQNAPNDRPNAPNYDRPGNGRDNPRSGERDRVSARRFSTEQAVQVCQDAIRQQAITQFRVRDVAFRQTQLDDNPGRRDWIVGTLVFRRSMGREETSRFSCSVDFDSGRVRSAQIERGRNMR